MLLQTNSYVVPKEKRGDHARLMRRFRQIMNRIGANDFEVYEQAGPNWGAGNQAQPTNRFVQIMRFRDRKHQLAVQNAERSDPGAQQIIAEFCELVNFPYQQERGLFVVGFYNSVLPVAPVRVKPGGPDDQSAGDHPEDSAEAGMNVTNVAAASAAGAAAGMYLAGDESSDELPAESSELSAPAEEGGPAESDDQYASEETPGEEEETLTDDQPLASAEAPLEEAPAESDSLFEEAPSAEQQEDAGEAPLPINFDSPDASEDSLTSEPLASGEQTPLAEQGEWADESELPPGEFEPGESEPGEDELLAELSAPTVEDSPGETSAPTPQAAWSSDAGEADEEFTAEIVGEHAAEETSEVTSEPSELDLSNEDLSHLPLNGEGADATALETHDPEAAESDLNFEDDLTLDLASRLDSDLTASDDQHQTSPGHASESNGQPDDKHGH